MSATYTLQMLLEHGPLAYREVVQITGWPPRKVSRTLEQLVDWGSVTRTGKRGASIYALA